jgi:hypothetical protein
MAKIKDLQTAMKLAKITNRPLEEFYDGPLEDESKEQDIEETVEAEQDESDDELIEDIQPIRTYQKATPVEKLLRDTSRDSEFISKYGGKMSDNGKLICETRQMSKKEYLIETKGMDERDILSSPLLYLMFRSEGQAEGHFVQWLSRFSKE